MRFEDFTEMPVWQTAFKLLLRVYEITRDFPSGESAGLVADMQKAANSIVHNIAQGQGREEAQERTAFFKASRDSGYELASQLLVSHELRYLVNKAELQVLLDACKSIIEELSALIGQVDRRTKS